MKQILGNNSTLMLEPRNSLFHLIQSLLKLVLGMKQMFFPTFQHLLSRIQMLTYWQLEAAIIHALTILTIILLTDQMTARITLRNLVIIPPGVAGMDQLDIGLGIVWHRREIRIINAGYNNGMIDFECSDITQHEEPSAFQSHHHFPYQSPILFINAISSHLFNSLSISIIVLSSHSCRKVVHFFTNFLFWQYNAVFILKHQLNLS